MQPPKLRWDEAIRIFSPAICIVQLGKNLISSDAFIFACCERFVDVVNCENFVSALLNIVWVRHKAEVFSYRLGCVSSAFVLNLCCICALIEIAWKFLRFARCGAVSELNFKFSLSNKLRRALWCLAYPKQCVHSADVSNKLKIRTSLRMPFEILHNSGDLVVQRNERVTLSGEADPCVLV